MKRATQLFNESQRKQVEQAVVETEGSTSCEIVPVIASASGRYDRAEDIIGLWLAVATAVAIWCFMPRQLDETGSWDGTPLYLGALAMIAGTVLAFMVGALAGSRIAWLRRLFTPQRQMTEEVAAKAREIFFDKRVHHTTGSTGLLFYISLFEHRAVVLGDRELVEKLGQPFLDQLCDQLTHGLREGNPTEALCGVIREAGQQLAGPLPRVDGDLDELSNVLVLLD